MTAATPEDRPTISVIMPVYNAERLLTRCLAPLRAMLANGEIDELIAVDRCAGCRPGKSTRYRAVAVSAVLSLAAQPKFMNHRCIAESRTTIKVVQLVIQKGAESEPSTA